MRERWSWEGAWSQTTTPHGRAGSATPCFRFKSRGADADSGSDLFVARAVGFDRALRSRASTTCRLWDSRSIGVRDAGVMEVML